MKKILLIFSVVVAGWGIYSGPVFGASEYTVCKSGVESSVLGYNEDPSSAWVAKLSAQGKSKLDSFMATPSNINYDSCNLNGKSPNDMFEECKEIIRRHQAKELYAEEQVNEKCAGKSKEDTKPSLPSAGNGSAKSKENQAEKNKRSSESDCLSDCKKIGGYRVEWNEKGDKYCGCAFSGIAVYGIDEKAAADAGKSVKKKDREERQVEKQKEKELDAKIKEKEKQRECEAKGQTAAKKAGFWTCVDTEEGKKLAAFQKDVEKARKDYEKGMNGLIKEATKEAKKQ